MTRKKALKVLQVLLDDLDDEGYGEGNKDYENTMVALGVAIDLMKQDLCEDCDVLDKIKDEIVEEFGGCAICEWDEDYDWDENDVSEWLKVGSINDILQIIDKHKENRG